MCIRDRGETIRGQADLSDLKRAKASFIWPLANSASPCAAFFSAHSCLSRRTDILHCLFKSTYLSLSLQSQMCQFSQLISMTIIKIVATRSRILMLQCTKFDFGGWGSAIDPAERPYSVPQTSYLKWAMCPQGLVLVVEASRGQRALSSSLALSSVSNSCSHFHLWPPSPWPWVKVRCHNIENFHKFCSLLIYHRQLEHKTEKVLYIATRHASNRNPPQLCPIGLMFIVAFHSI